MKPSYIVLICIVQLISAQDTWSQDEAKLAASAFGKGNYPKAIKHYEKLLIEDPDNGKYNHNIGVSYLRSNSHKTKAIEYLEAAESAEGYDTKVIYHLARAYHLNNQFDKAIETYLRYQKESGKTDSKVDRHIGNCYSAKKLITNPIPVTFVNLGSKINSEFPDYHPFTTANEDLLIFTSRRSGTKEFDGLFPSSIYRSARWEKEYEEAISIGATINTDYDEQIVGLSADGKRLFFYFDHVKEFGDVYECQQFESRYVAPEGLISVVNSEYLETAAAISPDGKTIFFASNRPGGYGGRDIYMTRKLPDGTWGPAQNLGKKVNTKHDEDFPNPSPNGKGIYFCSRGHANLGGFDLFYSKWSPGHNYFSRPSNLGYPINTPEDNITISFGASGKFAYVSAIRDEGLGDLDIYKIILDTARHTQALIRLSIENINKGHNYKHDTLYISDNVPDSKPYRYLPNRSGVYSIILKRGNYQMQLRVDGYEPYEQQITLDEYDYYPVIREEMIRLNPKKH